MEHSDIEFVIAPAEKTDAALIARTVMDAIGEELCIHLGDGIENLPKVKELFTRLAGEDNSQYSYHNTFVARDTTGSPAGAIVVYDGARLKELRKAFIDAANELLGWGITHRDAEDWGDEAAPDEIYIDSLYVLPQYRGNGIATALINHARQQYKSIGKPFGLLVEPENERARRLYEHLGFRQIGVSHFFSTPMLHLQKG